MNTNELTIGEAPSGYANYDSFFALQTTQGKRIHYALAVPLTLVPKILPIPDPTKPFHDNREVNLGHAKNFSLYIREHVGWHAGSLTIRAITSAVEFKIYPGGDMGSVKIGELRVPRDSNNAFVIIDGQHRVLGVSILLQGISDDQRDARSRLAKAERIGAEKGVIDQMNKELASLEILRTRVEHDSFTLDLLIEDDHELARQIFVDVANNARGVSKAITARFDQYKVVNRAVNVLIDSGSTCELIRNRVDCQTERLSGQNINLIGAGNLGEVIRIIQAGISGKISPAQERSLNPEHLSKDANTFFNILVESFPEFEVIASGTSRVPEMRKTSIVFSIPMIKVLAGVYHNLSILQYTRSEIITFFQKISRHTGAPVVAGTQSGDLWINSTSGKIFRDGVRKPSSRVGEIKQLVDIVTGWYLSAPPEFR